MCNEDNFDGCGFLCRCGVASLKFFGDSVKGRLHTVLFFALIPVVGLNSSLESMYENHHEESVSNFAIAGISIGCLSFFINIASGLTTIPGLSVCIQLLIMAAFLSLTIAGSVIWGQGAMDTPDPRGDSHPKDLVDLNTILGILAKVIVVYDAVITVIAAVSTGVSFAHMGNK